MKKGNMWLMEYAVYLLFICLINILVINLGNDAGTLIFGQFLNLSGFVLILIYTIYRLSKFENINVLSLFRFPFSLKEVFLIILITFVGKLFYGILIDFKFVRLFDLDLFSRIFVDPGLYHTRTIYFTTLIVLLVLAGVFAEELFFRGYLFHVKFKIFHKYTWIVNGFLWAISHIFAPVNIVAILPLAFLLAYVYQKQRNFRIPFCAHLLGNVIAAYHLISSYFNY